MHGPSNHDDPHALPRDPSCPACSHDHLWLDCDFCPCTAHLRNGID